MSEPVRESRLLTVAEEILRRRADSLAHEALADEADDRMGLLLFRLDEEWYAVKVGEVREIYQEYEVAPIPCVQSFILGVVNIRGEIISVTDIAALMRLRTSGSIDVGVSPAIVIQNATCTSAMVVDEIGDIVDVPVDSVEPPLSVIDKIQAEYIAGSVYVGERLIGLVNVDRILQPIDAEDR